jgi:hypothetical protein
MRTRRLLPAVSALALVLSGVAAAPALAAPPNDLCSNAQLITVAAINTPQTITGTNVGATSDIGQTCAIGDDLDVWYQLTAVVAGTYTFDTIGSLLDDTSLAAYDACGGSLLACNDDISTGDGIFWSRVTVPLTVGQSIVIRVSGYDNASGAFNLNLIATVPPGNDGCLQAETILVNQVKTGNTLGAGTDFALDDASCGTNVGAGGGKDVFYAFTPTSSGSYKVSLCGSAFDTVLAVLTDCTGSAASILACNDDAATCASSGLNSEIAAVTLSAGTTYLIRVAGYDDGTGGASGAYSLVIQSNVTPPTGVCCRGATCNTSIAQASCAGSGMAGAVFVSAAAACNAGGSTITPCCYADYNKLNGISVQDIFDYLNDWFGGSSLANTGGDGATGTLTVQAIFDYLNAWFAGGC